MFNYLNWERLRSKVQKSNYIIVSTHTNPDGDAIGSAIAFRDLCISLGKKCFIIIDSEVPSNLKFLDTDNSILVYDKSRDFQHFYSADLICILDLNDSKRLKSVQEPILNSSAFKVIIDHHIEPQKFADLYIVDTEIGSTGQLVKDFYSYFPDVLIKKHSATALYAAIMTDTGSFRFPRTNSTTHIHIADLIKCGADPVEIYEKIYNNNSLAATKILGEALCNIKTYLNGKLCIMTITEDMFRRTGAKNEDIDNFVEKTLSINGVIVGVMIAFVAGKDEIRVSLRSKGDFSVRDIASNFGGGGHLNAAGARLFAMNLDEAKSLIIEEVAKYI